MQTITYQSGRGLALQAEFHAAVAPMAPLIVAIHGGAWRAGSPERYRHLGAYFAKAGISLCAISYTLAGKDPSTKFPLQQADVENALHHLVENATELRIDAARVALLGDSAGAHLAALVALAPLQNLPGLAIKAVAGIYGVYDLLAQFEHDLVSRSTDQITEHLLGISPYDDRRPYFDASPVSHAVRRAAKPAFFISWGTDDDVVDHETQSVAFLTALKRAGYVARGLPVLGAPHFWIDEPLDEPGPAAFLAPRLLRFLQSAF